MCVQGMCVCARYVCVGMCVGRYVCVGMYVCARYVRMCVQGVCARCVYVCVCVHACVQMHGLAERSC